MSFLFKLEVDGLTDDQGAAIERASTQRDTWPIRFAERRRRRFALFGPRIVGPSLWMPEEFESGQHVLTDATAWDEPTWDMDPELVPKLAEAIRLLGELVPQGFSFRATWVGSDVREERSLSADDLAETVLASQLNEFTRYRVPALQ